MLHITKEAFSEVYDIIYNFEINNKIPKNFIELIDNNRDKQYKVNIDYTKSINDQELQKGTRVILALIYRDYLCSIEERECLIKQDKEILEKIEKEKREKYNYDNLFKNKETPRIKEEVVAMVEYKQSNFILKILNKIKSFFNKIL